MTNKSKTNQLLLDGMQGTIQYPLLNDIVFHFSMEKSKIALKGLISALLGLDIGKIKEVVVVNPIDFSAPADKEIILDVKVILNNSEVLDIELQTYKDAEWSDRSLLYLCRSFDNISKGQPYSSIKKTTFIAIMTYDLFPDKPKEFYARFRLLNEKYHYPYSSKFQLNVLYLDNIDIATDKYRENGLVKWAKLFKISTWEELKAVAEKDAETKEVAELMFKMNADDAKREYMQAHDRYLSTVRGVRAAAYEDGYAEATKEKDAIIAEKDAKIADKDAKIAALERELAELRR